MQYILTQDELDAIKAVPKAIERENKKAYQKLICNIARTMPIKRDWSPDEPPYPWGCIYNLKGKQMPEYPEDQDDELEFVEPPLKPNAIVRNLYNPTYCDNCPVNSICSLQQRYSQ